VSFNCGKCGKTTKARQKETKIVTAKRDREYDCKRRTEKGTVAFTTKGWEIVKEIRICPDCAIVGGLTPSENG